MIKFMGTPGPWEVYDHGVMDLCVYAKDDESCVALFGGDGWAWPNDDEVKANARLIAAAPELLEALESLIKGYVSLLEAGMDRITSLGGDCDPVPVMEQNDPWLRDARAAIDKATGENP